MIGQFAIRTYPVARSGQPFSRAGLFMGQTSKEIRPSVRTNKFVDRMAQTILSPPAAGMTKEQAIVEKYRILSAAAAEMLSSAVEVAKNLDNVYGEYTSYGVVRWVRTYAAQVALPAVGPLIDAWLQYNDSQKARAVIMSSLVLAEQWQNGIKNTFLPVFLDEIEAMDPGLSKQVDTAFETISQKYQRNTDLMTSLSQVPQVWLGQGAAIFFPDLFKQIPLVLNKIANLAESLAALLKAFGDIIESATKAAKAAPYFVLGGIGIIAIWLLVK